MDDIRGRDEKPEPKKRGVAASFPCGVVENHIGQVCQHRKYNYICVIFGWDPKCTASKVNYTVSILSVGVWLEGKNRLFDTDRKDRNYIHTITLSVARTKWKSFLCYFQAIFACPLENKMYKLKDSFLK